MKQSLKSTRRLFNSAFFLIMFVMVQISFAQDASWWSESGTEFELSTENQLKGLASLVNNGLDDFAGKTIKLKNDIVSTGIWVSIGTNESSFLGTFDGQGHTISELSFDLANRSGLFRSVGANGQIKNINVIIPKIEGISDITIISGLAYYYDSTKPIENCGVQADTAISLGSGLVYRSRNNLTITNSYARGKFVLGGLVGNADAAVTITNSYFIGNVSASGSNASVGGLVGYATGAVTITKSYASGSVRVISGYPAYAGGLVGYAGNTINITNSYANASVSVSASNSYDNYTYAGGLVGYVVNTATIRYSYASRGANRGSQYSYAGGIIGLASGGSTTLTSVYYIGSSTTPTYYTSKVNQVFISNAIKTDYELKLKSTFEDWDFEEVWGIEEGKTYPFLIVDGLPVNTKIETSAISSHSYTGAQIKPEPTVNPVNGKTLEKDTDYSLSYGENINAGTGTVTITGKGKYSGQQETLTFTISKKSLSIANAAAQNKVYDGTTGATITGTLTGVVEGEEVFLNITGTFANKDVGEAKAVTATATLTGAKAGNYNNPSNPTGLTANITPKAMTITLEPKTITLTLTEEMDAFRTYMAYNGLVPSDQTSVVTGTTVIYKDGSPIFAVPEIGTYPITLSGNRTSPNYTISYDNENLFLKVIASRTNISACTIASIPAQTYTGTQIKPAVSVTCGATTLKLGEDYNVAYGANTNTGTTAGSVTVTGIGAYTGTLSRTFAINAVVPIITHLQTPQITARAIGNAIVLENLPTNARVEVYNLEGKRLHSNNPENLKILKIMVQTKGVYIVKINNAAYRVAVK